MNTIEIICTLREAIDRQYALLTRMTPHLDGEVAITPDVILLRHSNFCGHTGITCYVHPSSMPALLREMRLRQSNHVLQ